MIAAIRRIRQKLNSAANSWMPPQDVTTLIVRPMPWELDRSGFPTAAFRIDIVTLAADGWCSDCGHLPARVAGRPNLRSYSVGARVEPFAPLLIRTQLASFAENELVLSHQFRSSKGEIIAALTTHLPLVDNATRDRPVAPVRGTVVPSGASEAAAGAAHA